MSLAHEIRAIREELAMVKKLVAEQRQLVGPFGLSMPDGTILTHTLHGLHYYVDPADTVITPQMVIYRQWEADITALVLGLLHGGGVFVDVGANFGYFTCLAASAARDTGRVFAIEPNPKLVELLRRNVDINWSIAPVEVISAAAAERAGFVTLHIPQGRSANASLSTLSAQHEEAIEVLAIRIDDVIPEDVAVDVMKVDVEGHELGVFMGATAVLARSPSLKLIVEWSQSQLKAAGVAPGDLLDFLNARGYAPFEATPAPEPAPLSRSQLMERAYANVLFLRR